MRPITFAAFAAALLVSSLASSASISREAIQRPIQERMDDIRGCWNEAADRKDPPPVGRMVLRFVIDSDGRVRKATIRDNRTGDAVLAQCVRKVFLELEYPEPIEPITVTYPLEFALDA